MAGKKKVPTTRNSRRPGKLQSRSATSNVDMFAEKTRRNKTHIFFWGGPLSNWYKGQTFPGARALGLTIARLDEIKINHPAELALSSRLLAAHTFICGEQWLMAMKGWLFERNVWISDDAVTDETFQLLSTQLLAPQPPPKDQSLMRELYFGSLCSILRTTSPKEQKALGRKCRNFDQVIWDTASVPVVVACCVARAEADPDLKNIYLRSGERTFVEGSPRDTVWGVGILWSRPSIEDPRNWRGANRLGVCHGLARDLILEDFGNKSVTKEIDQHI